VFPQNNIQFRDFRHQHNQIIVSQAHRWNPPLPSASRGPMKRKDCLIFQVNLQGRGSRSRGASITNGWSEALPGRGFHPLKSGAFHGALLRQLRFPAPGIGGCSQSDDFTFDRWLWWL